jgi:SAM-dependent methyltransferase
MTAELVSYYRRRAGEYDAIYDKPERQEELAALRSWLAEECAGRHVLEVACGTGVWSLVAASRAARVDAFDIEPDVLAMARAKGRPPNLQYALGDALKPTVGTYTACLAGFWFSHLLIVKRSRFLRGLRAASAPGAQLLMIDNVYAEGSSTPISRSDRDGNTYQMRALLDGSEHEVLKNFPDEAALRQLLRPLCNEIEVEFGRYYWRVSASFSAQ